jgi:alanyl-tRNA synthetase
MRFDFTNPSGIDDDTLAAIEAETNEHIRQNAEVVSAEMAYDEAIKSGALAFFGDKYGDRVRVVRMGDFSVELCGGTHVQRTGDIGLFKLRGEAGVAAGVRRIEGMTGGGALAAIRERELMLRRVGELVKGNEAEVAEKVERLLGQHRDMERQLAELQGKMAGAQTADLLSTIKTVNGKQVVVGEVAGADPDRLLEIADRLRERLGSGVVVLVSQRDGRVHLLAAVTRDLTPTVHAGKLIAQLAPIVGGKGGGRPELARAGGSDPTKIGEALHRAVELVP